MSDRPAILAHRGCHKEHPENSLAAIQTALAGGADGIECDVQLSADKVPVLLHDCELSAYTTTYPTVQRAPYQALRTLNLGSADTPIRIASLDEVLQHARAQHGTLNIEIKGQPLGHFGVEQRVIQLVRQYQLESRVRISSFSPFVLYRLKYHAPDIERGFLVHPRAFSFALTMLSAKLCAVRSIHIPTKLLSSKLPRLVTDAGYALWVWTANTAAEIHAARELGAAAIITDDVDFARKQFED